MAAVVLELTRFVAIDKEAYILAVGCVEDIGLYHGLCFKGFGILFGRLRDVYMGFCRARGRGRRRRSLYHIAFQDDDDYFVVAARRIGGGDGDFIAPGVQIQPGQQSFAIKLEGDVAPVQQYADVGGAVYALDFGFEGVFRIRDRCGIGGGPDDGDERFFEAVVLAFGQVEFQACVGVVIEVVAVVFPLLAVYDVVEGEGGAVAGDEGKVGCCLPAEFDAEGGHEVEVSYRAVAVGCGFVGVVQSGLQFFDASSRGGIGIYGGVEVVVGLAKSVELIDFRQMPVGAYASIEGEEQSFLAQLFKGEDAFEGEFADGGAVVEEGEAFVDLISGGVLQIVGLAFFSVEGAVVFDACGGEGVQAVLSGEEQASAQFKGQGGCGRDGKLFAGGQAEAEASPVGTDVGGLAGAAGGEANDGACSIVVLRKQRRSQPQEGE